MTVFYDAVRDRWVAQVGGFPESPKKRTKFATSEHDARIAEDALRQERNALKLQAKESRHAAAVQDYCTDATEFQLIYWVKYTANTRWRGGQGTMRANAFRAAERTNPYTDVREITLAWLDQFVEACRSQYGLGDSTITNYINALFVVLAQANRQGAIDRMPLRPEGLTASPKNELIPEDSWVEALIMQLGQQVYSRPRNRRSMQLFCRFLKLSGCRTGEALRLQWSDVSFARGEFYLRTTKNKKPHKLPLWPEMESLFIELKKINSERPFPFGYWVWYHHFSNAKSMVCSQLRLSEDVRRNWKGHRFRAMCLTEKADLGWDAFAIMDWANHSSLKQSQHYVSKSTKRFDRLRDLMSSQPTQQTQPVAMQPQPTQHQS